MDPVWIFISKSKYDKYPQALESKGEDATTMRRLLLVPNDLTSDRQLGRRVWCSLESMSLAVDWFTRSLSALSASHNNYSLTQHARGVYCFVEEGYNLHAKSLLSVFSDNGVLEMNHVNGPCIGPL